MCIKRGTCLDGCRFHNTAAQLGALQAREEDVDPHKLRPSQVLSQIPKISVYLLAHRKSTCSGARGVTRRGMMWLCKHSIPCVSNPHTQTHRSRSNPQQTLRDGSAQANAAGAHSELVALNNPATFEVEWGGIMKGRLSLESEVGMQLSLRVQ
jgi:hypothetical protein